MNLRNNQKFRKIRFNQKKSLVIKNNKNIKNRQKNKNNNQSNKLFIKTNKKELLKMNFIKMNKLKNRFRNKFQSKFNKIMKIINKQKMQIKHLLRKLNEIKKFKPILKNNRRWISGLMKPKHKEKS